jgi:general secretion pathway protein J
MTPPVSQRGFTLLEIVVALVVLGFLMVGLSQGVQFGLRAWDTESRMVNQRADMDGAERVLREVVSGADPGEFNDPSAFHGGARAMSFQSRLPLLAPGLPTRDVDVALGVDGQHRLVLRSTPHPHAELLGPPPPALENVLLEGIDHIELSYLRWPQQGGGWVTSWALPTLPVMLRIKLVFPEGDHRHWPDIVSSLMRSRFEE